MLLLDAVVVSSAIDSGAGSTALSVASIFVSGSPRMVKYTFCPGATRGTSASEISAFTTILSRLAIFTHRRRGTIGVHRLPDLHRHCDDGAVRRRHDLGAVEVELGRIDVDLGLLDLRRNCLQLALRGLHAELRRLVIRVGNEFLRVELSARSSATFACARLACWIVCCASILARDACAAFTAFSWFSELISAITSPAFTSSPSATFS